MRARAALGESRSTLAAQHRDINLLLIRVLCCSFYRFLILQEEQLLTRRHSRLWSFKMSLVMEAGGKKPLG